MPQRVGDWNPELYQASHSFVWKFGRDLLELLAPQPGERILDVGCGTGQLTADIAGSGARTQGIDKSASMIEQARRNFPDLRFEQADVTALPFQGEEFDAVFSNATLHWVRDAEAAAAEISRVLKASGRFIAEFGGRGNGRTLVDAMYGALESLGVRHPEQFNPWYYPGIGEYAALLERHGLEVTFAALFDRPTPLEDGEGALRKWLAMFGGSFTAALTPEQGEQFLRRVEERAAHQLRPNGVWTVDYRRLRVRAVKPAAPAASTRR
jgi:SAM-dependent methyltransferase